MAIYPTERFFMKETFGRVITDSAQSRPVEREKGALLLLKLEDFVDHVTKTDEVPFVPNGKLDMDNRPINHANLIARQYSSWLNALVSSTASLPSQCDYSEKINIFREVCTEMGLYTQKTQVVGTAAFEGLFNELVVRLRARCRSPQMVSQIRERRRSAQSRFLNYCRYVDALFDRYSRLVVIRIDLTYASDVSQSISINRAKDDLDHLLDNERRVPSIFSGKVGYIAKLEYGVERGFHWHVIYFFDGSVRKGSSHVYLAKSIGEYWKQIITKGQGSYWNCNDQHHDFRRLGTLGVGLIRATDSQLRVNLTHWVVGYLCKSTQHVRPRAAGRHFKTIQRGNLPKRAKGGRKRATHSADNDLT